MNKNKTSKTMQIRNLYLIKQKLEQLIKEKKEYNYVIPEIWLNPLTKNNQPVQINPFEYFLSQIEKIEELSKVKETKKLETDSFVIFNSFVRLTTAFDYNNLKFKNNFNQENEFQKTGTFLKTLALLPYLKKIGINILYLLPITKIGRIGRKGNLGSPYAIKNHYEFCPNLSEPFLELPIEVQFSALVEACHLLGIKVVLEFIFRTASIDNDLIPVHPDWFYWVDESCVQKSGNKLNPPTFDDTSLELIKEKAEKNDLNDLIEPDEEYKSLFKNTPDKVIEEAGRYVGIYEDGSRAVVPNAFADWPPDDKQPTWDDVTYLKLYENPKFNYIAYNTVRMYSPEILKNGQPQKELWQYLENIVPHYIQNFDIDGIMIDMGHSLPQDLLINIINKARNIKPDFILFEENFNVQQSSVEKGFNAVVGYLPFDIYNIYKIKDLIKKISEKKLPISFFGTAENHNTPRTVSRFNSNEFSKLAFAIICFLPAIPFIHNGFEFFESQPVNTGLDFSKEEIMKFSADDLPLFSLSYMNWLAKENLIELIISLLNFRKKYHGKFELQLIDTEKDILTFKAKHQNTKFIFGANYSKENKLLEMKFLTHSSSNSIEFINNAVFYASEKIVELNPFGFFVLRID